MILNKSSWSCDDTDLVLTLPYIDKYISSGNNNSCIIFYFFFQMQTN